MAFQLFDHALDGGFGAEGLAAADALERLFLLDHLMAAGGVEETEPGYQRDDAFRTRVLAQAALHAGFLGEAELRAVLVFLERPGRTRADAGQAKGTAFDIDDDGAEGRAGGQGEAVDRVRCFFVKVGQGQVHHRTLAPQGQEIACRHGRQGIEAVKESLQGRRVGLFDDPGPAGAVAEPAEDSLGERHFTLQAVLLAGLPWP